MKNTYLRLSPIMAGGLAMLACSSPPDLPTDSNRSEGIDYEARIAVEWTPAPATLDCPYPTSATMGAFEGATVPSNLSWEGFDILSDASGNVPVTNYFDCDGSKGYHALIFDTSQFG